MSVDLTDDLPTAEATDKEFDKLTQTGSDTAESVEEQLKKWEKYGCHYDKIDDPNFEGGCKYRLKSCPFCGKSKSNPDVWLKNGHAVYKCHHDPGCSGDTFKTWDNLRLYYLLRSLSIISAEQLDRDFRELPEQIIGGYFRRAEQNTIIGGPKSYKSMLVAQAAISVLYGIPFFGMPCKQGRVLLIDGELMGPVLRKRLRDMVAALNLDWSILEKNLDILLLRGQCLDINHLSTMLQSVPPRSYDLAIIDPLYRFLGDADENSNSDMAKIFAKLTQLASTLDVALMVTHHTRKGRTDNQSTTDAGAGAGAQSRSADVHSFLRPHEKPDCAIFECVLRSQPALPPFVIKFNYPLWRRDDSLSTKATATSNRRSPTIDEVIPHIPTEPVEIEWMQKQVKSIFGGSVKDAGLLLRTAAERHPDQVEIIKPHRQKYQIRRIAA